MLNQWTHLLPSADWLFRHITVFMFRSFSDVLWCNVYHCMVRVQFTVFTSPRLQGWVPPPAGPGYPTGASVDWGFREVAFFWPAVRPSASIPCLHPSAGCTCGQLHLLHRAHPLPESLAHPQLTPHRIPSQHPAWAPTPSLSQQKRKRGLAVWWRLLVVSVWPRRPWSREVTCEEQPWEGKEGGESWQHGGQTAQAGGLHRGQRSRSFTAERENPSVWGVRAPERQESIYRQREQSAAQWTFT